MEFQPLTPALAAPLADFFRREKGGVRAHQLPEHMAWSFLAQPLACPEEPVVEVVVEDGRILGCMGAVPQIILDREREIRGAFFVDWLVERQARRRKIGSQLIRRAAARFPVAVHLGSTPEGYATCATLGARDCGATRTARRIIKAANWANGSAGHNAVTRLVWSSVQRTRAIGKPRLDAGDANRWCARVVAPRTIDDRLQALSRRLARTHVCTLRTGARWEWLLTRSPLYAGYAVEVAGDGGVIGYAALAVAYRSGRLVGTVGDLCVGAIEHAAPVAAAAVCSLAGQGVDGLTVTLPSAVTDAVVELTGLTPQSERRTGTWLHPGYEGLLERPWFMTAAENLSLAAGVDLPVRIPALSTETA